MNDIARGINQRAYQNIDRSLNEFIEDLHRMEDEGHQIIIALDQIQRTPTLQLHPKTLNLKYYDEEAKILLIAYFDIIIHLQFAFEMYQIDIKYDNPNAIYNFQNFVESMLYGAISIDATYYDIPTSFNIIKKGVRTGKGSNAVNKKRIKKEIEEWEKTILMPQKARDIYSLVGKITYLLDSNRKSGELIIAASGASELIIASDTTIEDNASAASDKSLPIIANLKLILRKFSRNNREELLSLIPLKGRIPKECTHIY
jgi:hypothetical protein